MKKITTSPGNEYPADYCGVGYMGQLKMQLLDARPLSQIAVELEGCATIAYTDGEQESVEYTGFSRLMRLDRIDDKAVVILLAQEEEEAPDA